MAEPLKNSFGPDVARRLADDIAGAYPAFDSAAFVCACDDGFDVLELLDRGRHIAAALAEFLPANRGDALEILVNSMGPELTGGAADLGGMDAFYYLPHSCYIAAEGLEHFDAAMRANYELTKRFSSEFCIRPYIEAYPDATLAQLREWTDDPNVHVRRLVSEGSRPRLPWHGRLRAFMEDPAPVLELLELLKDDPEEYVRRSVANNLNDIAKDHPDVVIEVARRWWSEGDDNRRRLVRHALRTLIKAANPAALDVLGFGANSPVVLQSLAVEPRSAAIGDSVRVTATVENRSKKAGAALVDLRVHFVKANGTTSPKVFKGGEVKLTAGAGPATISKKISLRQHTTRKHYPGTHRVEAIVNGVTSEAVEFELTAQPSAS